MPPSTSAVCRSGTRDAMSAGVTTFTSSPNTLAIEALRLSSSKRSSSVAMEMDPQRR